VTEHNSSPRSASTAPQSSKKAEGLSKDEILAILAECEGVGLPETIDDHTLLVIDSFTAVWIQHLLEERHGLVVRLSGETANVNSVSGLQAFVNRSLGTDVG
jgi:hypothetical protein